MGNEVRLYKALGKWIMMDARDGQDFFEGTGLFDSEEEALAWIEQEGLIEVGKG